MSRRRIQLGHIDLNLLVALHTLLETGSVTGAARQVGVTQSAMSHSLRRLRVMLSDQLLVRGKKGMSLTERAEAMRDPLSKHLLSLQDTLRAGEHFAPERAEREFRLCATDHTQLLFAPALVSRLVREAPKVTLSLRMFVGGKVMDRLLEGGLDLVLGGNLIEPSPRIMRRWICDDRMMCAVREGHPSVGDEVSLEAYAALPHLLVAPVGRGPGLVDELLLGHDLRRHVGVRVHSFLIAPWILARSDCIITAPERILRVYRRSVPLRILAPPIEIPPVRTYAYWHERDQDDPGLRWLREVVAEAFAATASSEGEAAAGPG
ncbi:LysR family transcriptional regulator [Haliangium sp.]|uniref:LysR family transcriptional regulator n=1 Tax=Haliangium sp. TaxID=2663208 RepID=UPI003D1303FC